MILIPTFKHTLMFIQPLLFTQGGQNYIFITLFFFSKKDNNSFQLLQLYLLTHQDDKTKVHLVTVIFVKQNIINLFVIK